MAISVVHNNGGMNLTRSLEKILDECSASGELQLANRKLKDFPKYYGKFNLTDTVFAGESRSLRKERRMTLRDRSENILSPNMFPRFG